MFVSCLNFDQAVTASILYMVSVWLCRVKGPVFVAMFIPLQMIIAVIMGVSFLGDVLHLGRYVYVPLFVTWSTCFI